MIPADTKCTIKKVPGEGTYAHLLGANAIAGKEQGQRNTGTQHFKLDAGAIYGNGDSGFVVEPK